MGIFRQFPYTNFHDLNLDWLLDEMKKLITEWAEYHEKLDKLYNDITDAFNDFQAQFDAKLREYDQQYAEYLATIDIESEFRKAINQMIADGTFTRILEPTIGATTTAWLDANITEPTGVVIDESLKIRGAVADSMSAGKIRSELSGLYAELPITKINGYVDINTGAFIPYDNWTRTDYIRVNANESLYIESDVASNWNAIYDANKRFIKSFSIVAGTNKIVLPINAQYIAISGVDPFIDTWFAYQWITKRFNGVTTGQFEPYNNFAYQNWYNGSLNSSGEYVESVARLVTDYIPVSGNFEIHGEVWHWSIIIAEYDENKQNLYMQQYYYDSDFKRILRPETRYVRLLAYDRSNPTRELIPEDIYYSRLFLERRYIPSNKLKICTYNVGGYNYGVGYGIPANIYDEKLIGWRRVIADIDADVIGMQEYDTRMDAENQIWSNDVLWNYFYGYEETTGSQTALKSKPICSYHYTGQLSTGRYYCYGYIAGIFIISVHLSVGDSNRSVRIQEANEIINIVRNHERFIIMGDFNPMPNEEESLYKIFTDAGMNVANCGFFGRYYTWSSDRDDFKHYDTPTGTTWAVDNIITSSNIKIENAYPMPSAYDIASSDHIPFIAELEI